MAHSGSKLQHRKRHSPRGRHGGYSSDGEELCISRAVGSLSSPSAVHFPVTRGWGTRDTETPFVARWRVYRLQRTSYSDHTTARQVPRCVEDSRFCISIHPLPSGTGHHVLFGHGNHVIGKTLGSDFRIHRPQRDTVNTALEHRYSIASPVIAAALVRTNSACSGLWNSTIEAAGMQQDQVLKTPCPRTTMQVSVLGTLANRRAYAKEAGGYRYARLCLVSRCRWRCWSWCCRECD